jgi:hypothetical protein
LIIAAAELEIDYFSFELTLRAWPRYEELDRQQQHVGITRCWCSIRNTLVVSDRDVSSLSADPALLEKRAARSDCPSPSSVTTV